MPIPRYCAASCLVRQRTIGRETAVSSIVIVEIVVSQVCRCTTVEDNALTAPTARSVVQGFTCRIVKARLKTLHYVGVASLCIHSFSRSRSSGASGCALSWGT